MKYTLLAAIVEWFMRLNCRQIYKYFNYIIACNYDTIPYKIPHYILYKNHEKSCSKLFSEIEFWTFLEI